MSLPHHLSWDNFRSTVFIPGQQRLHRVTDSPYIEMFGDGVMNRIGVWLEVPNGTSIPPELSRLAFITTRIVGHKGRLFVEVATARALLQRQFYHFAVAVAERVIVDKRAALEAIALELHCFTDLLEEKAILGIERQLGLLGELIFLQRLIMSRGVRALDAWIGPMGEPHDFRVESHEFEIKTTVFPHRVHTIHGTEQLVPSKGCSLYLVSILLGPAGASTGFSLTDTVTQLSDHFATTPSQLAAFATRLGLCGFRTEDSGHYDRKFILRRAIGLVRVNNGFPAITRPMIQHALGPLATRIETVRYDVNVEGLEYEDGTVEFETTIRT